MATFPGAGPLKPTLLLLALLCTVSGPMAASKAPLPKMIFSPNCAAKKLCNKPMQDREPSVHLLSSEEVSKAPKGHLKPLGHPDFDDSWAGAVDVLEDLDPETFWTKYQPKKPFILKGFAKKSPAFTKWKDDAYLKEKFGEFKAKTEPKNEDRLTDYCNQVRFGQRIECGDDIIPYTETHMKLHKFMPKFKDPAFDKYVVTQMPDAMAEDFVLPTFHSCARRDVDDSGPVGGGPWMTQMYENNVWISHNGGRNFSTSVIHYDMNNQIMCQFDGTKEWIMWDLSKEAHNIPMWSGLYNQERHEAQGSDDSPIDPERVDLLRWPEFKKARWVNASLEAGDCLYTPAFLLHYVRSYGRNVAGMSMFQREEKYDPACNGAAVGEPLPLSKYDVMWSFPEEDRSLLGWNIVKMGYPNWKRNFLIPLAKLARKSKGQKLSRKDFVKKLIEFDGNEFGKKKVKQRAQEAFKEMDPDGTGLVAAPELFRSRSLRYLLKDIAVAKEGDRGNQEEDVEVDRYDLGGNTEKRKLEL